MHTTAHPRLIHASLVLLLLIDLLGLASFVFNQWLDVAFWPSWGLAALLALPVTMLVLPAVDALLAGSKPDTDIPFPGDKIPGTGQ